MEAEMDTEKYYHICYNFISSENPKWNTAYLVTFLFSPFQDDILSWMKVPWWFNIVLTATKTFKKKFVLPSGDQANFNNKYSWYDRENDFY